MSGLFITFEGGEGSGKSTQIKLVKTWLEQTFPGWEILITREPGGTPEAELIRNILVTGAAEKLSVEAEALLMIASRTEHVQKVIIPALQRGAIVLSDRFSDSTLVYQGLAHKKDINLLRSIHQFGFGDLCPDMTFVLDLPPEQGLRRAEQRAPTQGRESRFEDKGLDFHTRVRDGFIELASLEPDRICIVDASGTPEQTDKRVKQHIKTRLSQDGWPA